MKKSETTRQVILQQAARLFAQRGYQGVTMQAICDATSLSKGGVYRYFPNIDAIFLQLLQQWQAHRKDCIAAMMAEKQPAEAILARVLEPLRTQTDADSGLALAMYEYFAAHRQGENSDFLALQFARGHESWLRLIEYGCRTGAFCCPAPGQAAALILFAWEGLRMCGAVMDTTAAMRGAVADQIEALLGVHPHG